MEKYIRTAINIEEKQHLYDIFKNNYYLELGIIDIHVFERILKCEKVNIDEITYYDIQNKGLGHGISTDPLMKKNLPFIFYRKFISSNSLYTLALTYGLYYYQNAKKDTFAPVFLIPVTMYYENNKTYLRMTHYPFVNPALTKIIKGGSKIFIHGNEYKEISQMDKTLLLLSKLKEKSVRIDSYLTFVEQKKKDIIIPQERQISSIYSFLFRKSEDKLYYDCFLNKDQRKLVKKAYDGENIVLSGYQGTGKTTILKNVLVNQLLKRKKTVFLTYNEETINDVINYFYVLGLSNTITTPEGLKKRAETSSVIYEQRKDNQQIKEELRKKQSISSEFEQEMSTPHSDFKFIDLIKRFFLIPNFEKAKELGFPVGDDLAYIYKHEYQEIASALTSIEFYFQKIGSFKDSVWNQIPILNNIKYVNHVITNVFELNKSFKKLQEYDNILNDYGIKPVFSFSGMKRTVDAIEKMNEFSVPRSWELNVSLFDRVKAVFNEIENKVKEYNDVLNEINQNYYNINNIDIDKEIEIIFSFYQKKDRKDVDNIFKDLSFLVYHATKLIDCINEFNALKETFIKDINYDFFNSDNELKKVLSFLSTYYENNISNKVLNFYLNGNEKTLIDRLYILTNEAKNLDENIDSKKINKIEKEYQELTNGSYLENDKVVKRIKIFEEAFNSIKKCSFRKKIFDYLFSIKRIDRKDKLRLIRRIITLIMRINEFSEELNKYIVSLEGHKFLNRVSYVESFCNYIINVNNSKEKLLHEIIDNKGFVTLDDYYQFKTRKDQLNAIIYYMNNNNEYSELFDFLYHGVETNVAHIKNNIQKFEKYISLFTTKENAEASFKKLYELKNYSEEIHELLNTTGVTLNSYARIFKDGTSRYYFSSINSNIESLSTLLNAKEELVYYLNITSSLSVLNNYNLKHLIDYLVSTNDSLYITSRFSYTYFANIIKEILSSFTTVNNTNDYLTLLRDMYSLQKSLIEDVNMQIINNIKGDYTLKNAICIVNMNNSLDLVNEKAYNTIILDDAHLVVSGDKINFLKDKQTIICGDYHSNKFANEDLISMISNTKAVVLRKRVEIGPRKITYALHNSTCPYLRSLNANDGIAVEKEQLSRKIAEMYFANPSIKINLFMDDVERQQKVIYAVSEFLLQKDVIREDIINFLNNNLSISNLKDDYYIHADVNILVFKDYAYERSEIVTSNYIETLALARQKVIIYDEQSLLDNENIDTFFYLEIKKWINENQNYRHYNIDRVTQVIKNILIEKGYDVYYFGNGVNLVIKKKNSDELVSLIILFSNGFVYDVYNNYKDIYSSYICQGHKVILKTMLDLIEGPEKFVKALCEEIDE